MSALMMSQITITNLEAFKEYMAQTQTVAAPYGAELLFRGRLDQVLNGPATEHQLTVLVKFPDMETLKRWHASSAYQGLIELRNEASSQIMTAYQEMP